MKRCPQYRKTYDDAAIVCGYDSSPLLLTESVDTLANMIKIADNNSAGIFAKPESQEVERNRLNYRRELIKDWREDIESFAYDSSEFGATATHSAIKPHLSPEARRN